MKIATGFALLSLALAAGLSARDAQAVDTELGLQQAGRNAEPGTSRKPDAAGAWEIHLGADGARLDRDRLVEDLAIAQGQLRIAADGASRVELEQRIVDLTGMLDAAQTIAAQAGPKSDPTLSAQGPQFASVLMPGYYNYHQDITTLLCDGDGLGHAAYSVKLSSDMAAQAYPGIDDGLAQASASWTILTNPNDIHMTISGYAKVVQDTGTSLKSIGAKSVTNATGNGSVATPVAQKSDSFGCTMTTFIQAAAPINCGATTYASYTRTKTCHDLTGQ